MKVQIVVVVMIIICTIIVIIIIMIIRVNIILIRRRMCNHNTKVTGNESQKYSAMNGRDCKSHRMII